MQLPVVVIIGCVCRICKVEYPSLLVATKCCKEAKMASRTKCDAPGTTIQKSTDRQKKLTEFHHHEIDWQNLLSELEEFKKSRT